MGWGRNMVAILSYERVSFPAGRILSHKRRNGGHLQTGIFYLMSVQKYMRKGEFIFLKF